jgi:glycosyltransferase involved in cell wall biosynthesis
VAAVSHSLDLDGAPLAQLELLAALVQSGIVVATIISACDGPLRDEYESIGVLVKILPAINVHSDEAFYQSLASVQDVFAECRPDVVYANTLASFWAIIAAERMRLPTLWNVREVDPTAAYFDHMPASVRDEAYRCFQHPYRVIFVSNASFNMNAQFDSHDNFEIIYDAFDWSRAEKASAVINRRLARAQLGLADTELAIVIVGTVCERKGQLDLIEAVSRMPEQVASQVRVFVVGDRGGEYSKRLLRAKAAMPPESAARIHIVTTNSAYSYFSAADIAVCCSRGDTYPRVVQEAMFFELPLITTLACGCELVHENVNALIYSAGDVGMLANHLTKLVMDTALRERLASKSRKVLRNLPTFPGMVRQYGKLFEEAQDRKERAPASTS